MIVTAQGEREQAPTAPRLSSLLREILPILIVAALVFATHLFFIQNVQVDGDSMVPTLHNNELLLVDLLSYRLHPPRRGDIIILHPPVARNEDYVKRVIGLPGDTVSVRNGTVYIDGSALSEPYVSMPHTYSWGPERVPSGDLFVLGDNRNESYDSHLWSTSTGVPTPFLAEKEVVGRVMFSYWPLNALHVFTAPAFAQRS